MEILYQTPRGESSRRQEVEKIEFIDPKKAQSHQHEVKNNFLDQQSYYNQIYGQKTAQPNNTYQSRRDQGLEDSSKKDRAKSSYAFTSK